MVFNVSRLCKNIFNIASQPGYNIKLIAFIFESLIKSVTELTSKAILIACFSFNLSRFILGIFTTLFS